MDIPQPPPDEEMKNIIDRLANFVARNGPDFEMMTKQKQKDNPRFHFLFGGENYNYYTYRVVTEQAIIKHQATQANMRQQQMGGGGGPPPGGQGVGMSGNPNMTHQGQDFHGGQQLQQPQQTMFGQRLPAQAGGIPPGLAGPGQGPRGQMPPRMLQQQHQMQNRFGPPQRQPFHGPGQGQGNMSMSQQNFQNQGNQGQFRDFDQGPGRGPAPQMFQSRFQQIPQQQQQPVQPQRPLMQQNQPSMMGMRNPNVQQQNIHQVGQAQPMPFSQSGPGQQQQPHFGAPVQAQAQSPFGSRPGLQDQDLRSFNMPNPQLIHPNRFGSPQIIQQQQPTPTPPAPTPTPIVQINVEALQAQKKALEDRVRESEQNLAAQQAVLTGQHKTRVEEALEKKHATEISTLAAELNVDIALFDSYLEPIMESCTKESISTGKGWIFTNTSTKRHYELLTLFLLKKTTNVSMTFTQRLHIIYLVNDVLHHCMRKGAEDLQLALEAAVVPMFCYAKVTEKQAGNEENVSKLDKLFGLWESKTNYVSKEAVEKLRNYENTWFQYKNELVSRNAVLVAQIVDEIQKTFEGYRAQHQVFTQHVASNIQQIDQQIQQGLLQQVQIQQQQQQQAQAAAMAALRNISEANLMPSQNQPPQPGMGMQVGYPEQNPGGQQEQGPSIPDLSRPPPGFPPPNEKDLIPTLPYYELPAGLMVPLVKPEDDSYKPLDPKAIRLPPPCPPSEKLLLAVEAFYGPPSHDNPRDSEGWERLGLYEYSKAKNIARKQKEDDIREGKRQKSRSPTPIRRESSPSGRSPPRRRYQSKSPSPSRRRRSRSRSPSPPRSSRRRRKSRSRSPRRTIRRSPTPPSFSTAGLGMEERKLDESNKGHQLLMKMGWGGSGLGANEQGIEAPISGGDVRDKQDQYKGVGVSLHDPFESYRKTKAASFVERMRSRDERP